MHCNRHVRNSDNWFKISARNSKPLSFTLFLFMQMLFIVLNVWLWVFRSATRSECNFPLPQQFKRVKIRTKPKTDNVNPLLDIIAAAGGIFRSNVMVFGCFGRHFVWPGFLFGSSALLFISEFILELCYLMLLTESWQLKIDFNNKFGVIFWKALKNQS